MSEGQRLHSLIVDLERDVVAYQYMCRDRDAVPPLTMFRKPVRIPELRDLAEALSRVLAKQSAGTMESNAGEGPLREWGGQLYDKIIPAELAEKLRGEAESAYLVLYLDPEMVWVPWELLWDGDQFLCRRFRVARLLQKTGGELRAAEARLQQARSGRGALIIFGDVSGLEAGTEKAEVQKALTVLYGPNIWFHSAKSAADVLEQLKKDYEICHFIGHGVYIDETRGDTGWKFADGTVLTCRDIEAVSSQATFPLLIFANSCDSAHPPLDEAEGYISTLYRAFLRQGVPHYIGAIARIPDQLSKEFARSFYQLLAEGSSLGEALGETRRTASQRSGVPIWAYYVHYGDPTYRFVGKRSVPNAFPQLLEWEDLLEPVPAPVTLEPFVDRDKEIAEAQKHLRLLSQGKSSVLFLVGDAGVGKSAFLQKIISDATQGIPGIATAIGACNVQLGVADPYSPFKEVFRSLVRNSTPLDHPQGEAMTIGELVIQRFMSFPHLIRVFRPEVGPKTDHWQRVCQRLGLPHQSEIPAGMEFDQTAIFDQVANLLRGVARETRLLLAVDNLHWADDSSVALFFHLSRMLSDAPVMLIGTYRPDLIAQSRPEAEHPLKHAINELRRYGARIISVDFPTATAVDRERIETFAAAFLDEALPGHKIPPWFIKRLARHTGGNGLFLKELVSYFREKGQIAMLDGAWRLASDVEHFELPESVAGIIEERIAKLSKELREILTCASVEGEDFTAQVLASIQQVEEDRVLSRLIEDLKHIHQLVDERGEQELSPDRILSLFHFRNALVQQHLYQELGIAQRRRLHKKVGECLEALYGEKRTEIAGHLAAHFRIAREWNKALSYAVDAARRAAQIYANRESIRNYKTALELWELTPEKDLELKATLLLELGEVYKYVSMFDEAVTAYEQIVGMDETAFRPSIRAYALDGIGDVHRARGDYGKALQYYNSVEAMAENIGDEKLLTEVWTDLTDLLYRMWMDAATKGLKEEASAHRAKSQEYAERVLRESERMGMWENLRRGHVTLGNLMLKERRFAEAQQSYANAIRLAEEHGLPRAALNNLGELMRRQGKYREALKYYEEYLNWALKTGAIRDEIMAYNNAGIAYLANQEFERARDLFGKAFELNKPLRKRFSAVLSLALKGLSFELQGAVPAALELYREALNIAGVAGTDAPPAEVYARLGKMLFAYDEPEPAAYFLKKYLEYSPPDAQEIQGMVKSCSTGVATLNSTASRDLH